MIEGDRYTLSQQVQNPESALSQSKRINNGWQEIEAVLGKVTSHGSNDYINNYRSPLIHSTSYIHLQAYSPKNLAHFLTSNSISQILVREFIHFLLKSSKRIQPTQFLCMTMLL